MQKALRGAEQAKKAPPPRREPRRSRAAIPVAIAIVAVAAAGAKWLRGGATDARAEATAPRAVVPPLPSASAPVEPAPSVDAVVVASTSATAKTSAPPAMPRVAIAPRASASQGARAVSSAPTATLNAGPPLDAPEEIPSALLDRRR
jgi:hypothetical protein